MAGNTGPEAIIIATGGWGRFQVILCILMHLMKTPTVISMYVSIFMIATPRWWCQDVIFTKNLTTTDLNGTKDHDLIGYKTCVYMNSTKCLDIIYDDSMSTMVSEWNMVCESSWIPSMIVSIQMIGLVLGNVICGQVADIVGRKTPVYMSHAMLIVGNLIGYFSNGWVMLAAARVLCGLGMGWFLTVQCTLMTETTMPSIRPWVIAMPSWPLEACLFALIGYLVPDWRKLHLIVALMTISLLPTWFFVPESFRWYLSHNKRADAKRVINYIGKINSHKLRDEELDAMLSNTSTEGNIADRRKYTVLHLFRTRHLLKVTLLMALNWFALGMVTYSIRFGIQALSGNFFLNTFIFSIITVPLSFVAIWMCNKFGRRFSIIFCYVISAIGCLVVGIIQHVSMGTELRERLTSAFAMIATLGIGTAWGPVSTSTVELYPTVVRNIGFGFMSMFARVGSVIAPQLAFLDTQVGGIMYFLCGVLSMLCVLGTTFLAETKGKDLNDKIRK